MKGTQLAFFAKTNIPILLATCFPPDGVVMFVLDPLCLPQAVKAVSGTGHASTS